MVDMVLVPQRSISSEPVGKFIPRPVAAPKDLRECPKIKDVIMMIVSDQLALIINHQAGHQALPDGCQQPALPVPTFVQCPQQRLSPSLPGFQGFETCNNNQFVGAPLLWGPISRGVVGHVLDQHTKDLHPEILNVGRVKVKWVVICKCPCIGTNKDSTIASVRLSLSCSL